LFIGDWVTLSSPIMGTIEIGELAWLNVALMYRDWPFSHEQNNTPNETDGEP